jgi:hypothetical protein
MSVAPEVWGSGWSETLDLTTLAALYTDPWFATRLTVHVALSKFPGSEINPWLDRCARQF